MMRKNLQRNLELRFIIKSNIGHELILSEDDMDKIAKSCLYQNKTQYKKLQPFISQCKDDYHNTRVHA
jgi:hypothetical protein